MEVFCVAESALIKLIIVALANPDQASNKTPMDIIIIGFFMIFESISSKDVQPQGHLTTVATSFNQMLIDSEIVLIIIPFVQVDQERDEYLIQRQWDEKSCFDP